MTDATLNTPSPKHKSLSTLDARTKKRNAAEKRFRAYGLTAILIGLFFLVVLFTSIIRSGMPAFTRTVVDVEFTLSQAQFEAAEKELFKTKAYSNLFIAELQGKLGEKGVEVEFDQRLSSVFWARSAARCANITKPIPVIWVNRCDLNWPPG